MEFNLVTFTSPLHVFTFQNLEWNGSREDSTASTSQTSCTGWGFLNSPHIGFVPGGMRPLQLCKETKANPDVSDICYHCAYTFAAVVKASRSAISSPGDDATRESLMQRAGNKASRKRCDFENAETLRFLFFAPKIAAIFL